MSVKFQSAKIKMQLTFLSKDFFGHECTNKFYNDRALISAARDSCLSQ